MALIGGLALLGGAMVANLCAANLSPNPAPLANYSEPLETRYPFVFCDSEGTRITLPKAPLRIVSLAPSLTETLFALGCGDRLLGNTRYCNHPREAQRLPKIGGPQDPQIEKLLQIQPDLILATPLTSREAVRQMRFLGLNVAVWDAKEIRSILSEMDLLGKILNHSSKSKALVEGIQERIDRVAKGLSENKRPKTVLLYGTQSLFSTSNRTFAGEILEISGASNIAASLGNDWPLLSKEKVLLENPEVILIASSESAQGRIAPILALWKTDPFWKHLSAVQAGRVYEVPDSLLSIPGPRVAEAVERVAELLQGTSPISSPTP